MSTTASLPSAAVQSNRHLSVAALQQGAAAAANNDAPGGPMASRRMAAVTSAALLASASGASLTSLRHSISTSLCTVTMLSSDLCHLSCPYSTCTLHLAPCTLYLVAACSGVCMCHDDSVMMMTSQLSRSHWPLTVLSQTCTGVGGWAMPAHAVSARRAVSIP